MINIRQAIYRFVMILKSRRMTPRPADINFPADSIFNIEIKSIDGLPVTIAQFKGKKILIVNVASECGYTPQYKELQQLYKEQIENLVVLGFPSNDFGKQEPGSNTEIKLFCERRYHVTFPMFEKSHVTGKNKNALYRWLTDAKLNGWNNKEPEWNFCKYLVDENGMLICLYSETVDPFDEDIIRLVKKN